MSHLASFALPRYSTTTKVIPHCCPEPACKCGFSAAQQHGALATQWSDFLPEHQLSASAQGSRGQKRGICSALSGGADIIVVLNPPSVIDKGPKHGGCIVTVPAHTATAAWSVQVQSLLDGKHVIFFWAEEMAGDKTSSFVYVGFLRKDSLALDAAAQFGPEGQTWCLQPRAMDQLCASLCFIRSDLCQTSLPASGCSRPALLVLL